MVKIKFKIEVISLKLIILFFFIFFSDDVEMIDQLR
jgi:hypothetical protein